jgi:acetyltransferase-like isoleucine patch superfamily enzyme
MITNFILSKVMEFLQRIEGLKTKDWKLYNPVWIDNPKNLSVGEGSWMGPFVYITMQNPKGYLKIGKYCEVNPFCVFLCGSGIEIGDHVLISPGVKLSSSTNYYEPNWEIWKNPHVGGKVIIEDNVHIGTNTTILPNLRIGEGSVIGAGAVVTKDIPGDSIAVGVPARVIKRREK